MSYITNDILINSLLVKNTNITTNIIFNDLTNIYNYLNNLQQTNILTTTVASVRFNPGVYNSTTACNITGICYFDGKHISSSLFIFKIAGALNTAASVTIILINGALASNIFWIVQGAASLGANTNFIGTIIAVGAINIGHASNIVGRLLSFANITIDNSKILVPNSFTSINLYNLLLFSIIVTGGTIANVDGGVIIIIGNIGVCSGSINFIASAISYFYTIGSIYKNTETTNVTIPILYNNNVLNSLVLSYGSSGISNSLFTDELVGNYILIYQPSGIIIDSITGIISFDTTIQFGTYNFFILYYNNSQSFILTYILNVIPLDIICTGIDKMYDTNIFAGVFLNNIINNDIVFSPQAYFNDSNIGNDKIVTISGFITGPNASNYNLITKTTTASIILTFYTPDQINNEFNYTQFNLFPFKNNNITVDSINTDFIRIQNYFNNLLPSIILPSVIIDGNIFYTGIYNLSAAYNITGDIIFDAQNISKSLFIFKIGGALNTAAGVTMILINGATASNIYWIVVGAASLGANTTFFGNIITQGAISIGHNSNVIGRLLSEAAISIDNSIIFIPINFTSINLYNILLFTIVSLTSAINSVDSGRIIILGNISAPSITFATPLTSPSYLIGCNYTNGSIDTGDIMPLLHSNYAISYLVLMYGSSGVSSFPTIINAYGKFILIYPFIGVTIDKYTGLLSFDSTIVVGIHIFNIFYYNAKIAYLITFKLTVLPKDITCIGINKIYDNNLIGLIIINGIINNDIVFSPIGFFSDINIGLQKIVTISGSLTGINASNYNLITTITYADIIPKNITCQSINKIYDKTLFGSVILDGIFNNDLVFSPNVYFDNINVGIGKTMFIIDSITGYNANNYNLITKSLSGNIIPKNIYCIGINKIYDNTNLGFVKLIGIINNDNVLSPNSYFNDIYVGNGKIITISGFIYGNDSSNYKLMTFTTSANITQKIITIINMKTNKPFDGTNTFIFSGYKFLGNYLSDGSITLKNYVANFNNASININKLINVTNITLSGCFAYNYTINNFSFIGIIYMNTINYFVNNPIYISAQKPKTTSTTTIFKAGQSISLVDSVNDYLNYSTVFNYDYILQLNISENYNFSEIFNSSTYSLDSINNSINIDFKINDYKTINFFNQRIIHIIAGQSTQHFNSFKTSEINLGECLMEIVAHKIFKYASAHIAFSNNLDFYNYDNSIWTHLSDVITNPLYKKQLFNQYMASGKYSIDLLNNNIMTDTINFNFNDISLAFPLYLNGSTLISDPIYKKITEEYNDGGTRIIDGVYNIPILIRFS